MLDQALNVSLSGTLAHVELNRPKALNALNLEMVSTLRMLLHQWKSEAGVKEVLVTGRGERAFCAGGDVKSVCLAGRKGERGRAGTLPFDFFREEYALNSAIAAFPKPYVSFWDGITMGGGVGVSIMGSHRIATERTVFAMPETGIGFFPDVGGSHFLSKVGPVGILVALTGQTLDAAASLEFGFATHFVPSDRGPQLLRQIEEQGVEATLESLAETPTPSQATQMLMEIANQCFCWPTADEIRSTLANLASGKSELAAMAKDLLDALDRRSPTSIKVALEQLKRGRDLSFADCMVMEYRMSQAFMQGHDFYEGVRAVLVDKDHSPAWRPASLDAVTEEIVESHFVGLGEHELVL